MTRYMLTYHTSNTLSSVVYHADGTIAGTVRWGLLERLTRIDDTGLQVKETIYDSFLQRLKR